MQQLSNRFFRHRELHLVLLALLAERPMHGYELMGALADRFGPAYRPSAGSVYPALESLSSEQLIRADKASDPTTYELTTVGEVALARRSGDLLKLEQRTGVLLGGFAAVESALTQLAETARRAASDDHGDQVEQLLSSTITQLEHLARRSFND